MLFYTTDIQYIYTSLLLVYCNLFVTTVHMLLAQVCPKLHQFCSLIPCLITTCSSAPVCDLTVLLAVPVLKLCPCSSARCRLGFDLSWKSLRTQKRASVAVWDSPGPFFLLPYSRQFLYTPLHSNLNLTDSLLDPLCSQTQRSH